MARTGRPSEISPEITEQIAAAIQKGHHPETAAALAGIHRATYYRWLERGEKQAAGDFRDFCDAIKKALAKAENRILNRIIAASREPQTWQAAAWLLERRFPRHWARERIERALMIRASETFLDEIAVELSEGAREELRRVLAGKGEDTPNR